MSWTTAGPSYSRMFRQTLADICTNATAMTLSTGSFKAALFNNSITPDQNVSGTALSYNGAGGQWLIANEVSQAGQWAVGGVLLAGEVINVGTPNVVFWDANDTASGTAASLSNATGCLVYESVLGPMQGVCFNYFGGSNSVVNGTFTILWNVLGLWRATL